MTGDQNPGAGIAQATNRVVGLVRATDGAEHAATVAAWAGALADGLGLDLELVATTDPLPRTLATAVPGVPVAAMTAPANAPEPPVDLGLVADRAGVHPSSRRELAGPCAGVLEELAGEPSTALVVAGDDGQGPGWALIGPVGTREVLRELPVALLLVPRDAGRPPRRPLRIAAAVLDAERSGPVLALAATLADRLGGGLLLLADPDAADRVRGELRTSPAPSEVRAMGDDRAAELRAALAEGDADLLVLPPPERGLLASALLGSIVHTVASGARGPVLIAPGARGGAAPAAAPRVSPGAGSPDG